jgi:hypothetical protein
VLSFLRLNFSIDAQNRRIVVAEPEADIERR